MNRGRNNSIDDEIWEELLETLEEKRLMQLEMEFEDEEVETEEYKTRERMYGILEEKLSEAMMQHLYAYCGAWDVMLSDAARFFYRAGLIDCLKLLRCIFGKWRQTG